MLLTSTDRALPPKRSGRKLLLRHHARERSMSRLISRRCDPAADALASSELANSAITIDMLCLDPAVDHIDNSGDFGGSA